MPCLELPYPPSVNEYWHYGRRGVHLSPAGRSYRQEVTLRLRSEGLATATGPVALTVAVHPPDRRRRDLDNVLKALLDGLAYGGVYGDDSQVARLVVQRCQPVRGGKVIVVVDPLEDATP